MICNLTIFDFQAIVLEGKYWKRKLDTVTTEYKRWRMYFKHKNEKERRENKVSVSVKVNLKTLFFHDSVLMESLRLVSTNCYCSIALLLTIVF